jgi:protocatechuate 3,4-dioxygenase beta subunit
VLSRSLRPETTLACYHDLRQPLNREIPGATMRFLTLSLVGLFTAVPMPPAGAAAFQANAQNTRVSGRVIEQGSEAPISGARVVIAGGGRSPAQTFTDRDGRYTLERLEPGSYQLAVDKVGYVRADTQRLPTIRLVAGQVLEIPTVALQKTGVISGRLVDPQGEPLQDVSIRAIRRDTPTSAAVGAANTPNVADLLRQTGRTNDLGEFRLYGLPPGDYIVVASPQPFGFATAAVSTAMLPETFYPGSADAAGAQVLTVTAGQTVVVDFPLFAAAIFNVSGTVVDESGVAVPGATVTIAVDHRGADAGSRVEHAIGAAYGGISAGQVTTQTDSTGRFTIAKITSGAYYATAAVLVRTAASGLESAVADLGTNRMLRSDPVEIVVNEADVESVTIVLPVRR